MRIVNRETLMALPAGALYSKGKPVVFDGLYVKGDTIKHKEDGPNMDWWAASLIGVSDDSNGGVVDRMFEMAEKGVSYPLNELMHRDGCFDDTDMFLVYEAADLDVLQDVVAAASTL